jgi:hypothetical protein
MCHFSDWLNNYSSSHSPDQIMETGRTVHKRYPDAPPEYKFQALGTQIGYGVTETQMNYLMEFSKTKIPSTYGPYFRFGLQVGDVVWGSDGC